MAALPSSSHVHATSKSRTYTWMSDVTRSDKAGNHYSTVCIQWSLASAEAPPPLSLTNPLVELPSTIGGAGNVRATSEPDCTIQMVRQLSAVTGSTPAPATKACIIRVVDCVTARSASKECASSMSIALVEDLWASSARHAPGQDCQRFIRLRWFLTINGIAISRARLPRGSQGHPDELFLTTFSTLERLDCIDGLASVKFGNASHVVPPSSDVSDSCGSWSSEEAGGRSTSRSHSNRNRFCKFEYDHTLSVFVPLLSSFLIDRIASLPGQVVHDNTQLSVEDGPDGENVTPDVAVTGPTREPLRERAAGNPFSTPIRRQKTGSAPSSRASTPLPEEVSPKAQNVPGPYRVFSSSFHGVSMHKASQRWHAQVRFQGKRISLGYYDDETVAATAYDNVARKLGLPATKLNFAESGERLITRKNGGPMFDQQETAATAGTPSRPLTASAPVDVPSSSTLPVDADSAVDALPSMCNWSGLDFLVAAAMLPSPKPVSSSLFMLCTTSTKKRGRDTVCLEAGPEETLTINTMPMDADTYFHTKRVQAVVPSAFRPNILRR